MVKTMQYRTKNNDILDRICFLHYGISGVVQKVLESNPHLADYGPVLPSGLLITLPDIDVKADKSAKKTVSLWD